MIARLGIAPLAALVLAVAPVQAQRGLRPVSDVSDVGVLQFTPYAGYVSFGNFYYGPYGSSLYTKGGAVVGGQLAVALAPTISVVGNVAYSNPDMRVGVPVEGGYVLGTADVWLYDADVQFSVPTGRYGSRGAVQPFFQVGAGAMHYDITTQGAPNTTSTNFAWNAGVGLDAALSRVVGLRFMVKDYIGKFNFHDATGVDVNGPTAQNWTFTGGLRFGF